MARRNQEVYGNAVIQQYRDQANQIQAKYNEDPWSRRQKSLYDQQTDFSGYLNSGNYSVDNNKKYRDMATQAVADLDTEMKRYGTSSNEYKTLKGYKTYYENALPTFDRLDVGANVQDYLSYDQDKGFTNWHSQDDYNTQKSYLDQQRQAVQTELDGIEDQTSVDYQNLKSWQDQLDMYANALEERNNWDKQFEDVNDYTAYERAGDYKNSIQAKQTLKNAQDQLKETEARLKAMQMKFAAVTDLSTLDGADAQEYQDFINLQQDYKQLQENVTNAAAEVAGLEKWQKNTATYNLLSQYGEDADYEQVLNDLRAAREKAQEGTEDWAKIDLQIRAIAGENEDGLNENGQYDDSTLLGRSIMRDFDLDAAQKRMDEIDQELKDLGVSTNRFWGGVTNADNAFGVDAAGMVYTDENAVGESDPRVMALRQEKTELTRKMNSAEKFQEKDAAETAFKNLSDEDHAALQEEGLKHISQRGKNFYRDGGYDPTKSDGMLENFQYLDDELGGDIRDMLIEAVGAEALGKDIGYTVDDIMRLYQGDINHIAGKKEADKISAMDSDFARWNRQVLGVGTQAGLNQFVTGIRQAFSDDYIEPNKTSYKAQYTREDLKRYGDEDFINGSNVSQVLFDTTQTTANMLPMIAASYLLTKAGAAPIVGELVGAGMMGVSSGGNTYQQALSEGWDKTDAKAYATILGAAEGTMQYLIGGISGLGGVGEEGLLKAAQGINNAAVRFATETGIHILSETTEELAQNRLQRYLDYKLGATDDADWMSWNDDDWYTVIVTALSTGAMEGLPGGINAVRNTKLGNQLAGNAIPGKAILKSNQARNEIITQIGEAMKGNEALHETLTTIGTNLMEEGSEAYDLAQRMESGKAAKSAWNYGVLYSEILSEYQSRNGKDGIEDGMAAVIGGAIKYHELASAKTAVEEAEAKAAEVRKANPGSEVLSANASALTELGVTDSKQAQKYGALVNKVLSGTDLSEAEMNTLVGDSTAAQAARVLIGRQNGMLKADTTAASAKEIINGITRDMRIRKQQQKAANKMSVVQAAMEAANKYEVSRAAANADLRGVARTEGKAWQGGSIVDNAISGEQDVNWKTTGGAQDYVRADERRTIEKADADVEAAQARLDQLKKMSYKDMAALHAMGAEDAILEAAIDEDMTNEMAALQKRAEELSSIRIPSKEQRTQLADIRDRQAALKTRMLDEYQRTLQRAETARTEQQRNEESAAIAAKTNDSVETIVVGGARMTRDAFVQDFSSRLMKQNPNLTQEQANAQALERFNELAAQTQKTEAKEEKQTEAKSERKSKVKPEKKEVVRRQKLDGKAHYWAGGSLEGVQYGAVTEAEAEQAIGKTELDFVNNVLSKLVNVTLIKSLPGENGQLVGANGIFYRDGRIYLDINAGTEAHQRSVILTAAHELTHFIRTYNGKAYDKLRDFVEAELKQKGEDIEKLIKREQDNYKVGTGKELSRDKAIEEVVANACETMLTDANAINRFAAENPTEAKTILDWLTDFFQRIADAFEDLIAIHPEAKAMQDNINSLRDLWLNALVEADANAVKTTLDDHVQTEVNAEGEEVATTSDNGQGMFNLRTWRDGGRTALEEFLTKRVKKDGLDQKQADEMLEQMDKLYDVCEEYDDGTYGPFSAWSNATVIMGKDGKPAFSVVKANDEYALSLDFSLVCKKRRALDAVFNEMIERGLMNRVIGDEMFLKMYPASIVQINNYIREAGFETACALCFVDTKRYLQAMKADEFCSIYNGLVNSLIEGTDRKAKYFNYGGDMEFFNTWNNRTGIETLPDFELNWSHINEVLRTEKPTSTLYRMADYIKKNPEGRKLAARGDFMSTNGIDAMTIDHARLLELFHAKQGNSNAKDVVSDTPYFNEVLKSSSFKKDKAYSVGGVRIQSFSDYVGRLVFDYIQMVGDLAAKELPAHSYTKEYQFAMQFGKTGIKINMSLVPRVMEDGVAPGLDKDGNYAWMDGQSFGSTVYDNNNKRLTAQQGYELAIQIQNADGYSTNCGTIAVGVSDEHIRKMLDDPNIRMIIPYHKSGINHLLAEMNQIGKYKDYTLAQSTRYFVENEKDGVDEITGKRGHWTKLEKGDFNWNDNLQRLEREGKGARECAQLYKDWCAARGYLPKFNDFAYHPNYYKVLEDFTAYDKDGTTPAPLQGVQLNFPVEGDAFGSMQKLIQDGLQEDAVLQAKQDVGVKGIVDRIEAELPAWEAEFREKGDKFAIETSKASMAKTEMRDATQNDIEAGISGENQNSGAMFSARETDPDTLKFLNDQVERGDYTVAYKTFLEIKNPDGTVSLYPPMASKQTDADGKRRMANSMAVGEWEKSVGNPNSKNIIEKNGKWYYRLVKDNGKTVDAAYDPYQHSSNVVLNDQFEEAYQRPNLVTYEVIIPNSELTAGYRYSATRDDGKVVEAALPVGEHPWKKGTVAGKLKNTDRTVYMTRWLMPNRRLDDSEVAHMYQEILAKEENPVPIPFNVVPPGLLTELEKIGVPIDYEGSPMYKAAQKRRAEKSAEPSYSLRPEEEMALYIKNDTKRGVDFVDEIFEDRKHGETRGNNQKKPGWYGVTRGGKNGQVVGRVELGEPIQFNNDPNSDYYRPNLYADSKIEGTEYDIKPGETKWYYPIINKEDFRNNPKPVLRNGAGGAVYQREEAQAQQAMYSSRDAQYNDWAPEFYSKMANTINEWTNGKGQPLGPKMAANQVVGWLKGKGVKSEEIKWSGIIPYLEGKKTVTKEELQQVMAENEIKIETKVLESGAPLWRTTIGWLERDLTKENLLASAIDKFKYNAKRDNYEYWVYDENGNLKPGMVELVDRPNGKIAAVNGYTGEILYEAERVYGEAEDDATKWGRFALPGGSNYREILFKQPGLAYTNRAMQTHWGDEKGVLAHTRVQDFDNEGKRILFVEELQSDLHNAGTQEGFAEINLEKYDQKEIEEFRNLIAKSEVEFLLSSENQRLKDLESKLLPKDENYDTLNTDREITWREARFQMSELLNRIEEKATSNRDLIQYANAKSLMQWILGETEGPLSRTRLINEAFTEEEASSMQQKATETVAPFVTEEEREAARNYDRAYEAFRKVRDKMDKERRDLLGLSTPNVPFAGSADTYHEYVMKHLLRMAAEGGYDAIAWTSSDIQIDRWRNAKQLGYGVFKDLYDKKLVQFMNKYGKQWGTFVEADVLGEDQEVWSVPINDAMRKSVLETGQPMFSSRDTNAPDNSNPYPDKTLQHDILEHVRKGDLAQWLNEQKNAYDEALENSKERPPVIPAKGFVPRPTEAENRAIDNRNRALIQAKGAMRPSEKAANNFRMAKEDEKGNRFHRYFQNVITAEQTQPAWDQAKKFAFTDVAGTYVPDSNKADLKWAKDVIHEDGRESAIKQFNRAAIAMDNSQHNITKNLALGQQLLIETSRDGDMQAFLDVLSSLTLLSSQAGKSLQAFRMLKQSGPIGELYYVEKAVKQLNERNAAKIQAGKMDAITIPEDFANAVLTAATEEEQDKAVDSLIAEIGKQVPVTLMDKWNAWRYLAMLGNARTHIRNLVGNAVFVPLRFAKDLMAAGGEFVLTKAGLMDETDRRKALFVSKELKDFAKQDALAMQKELQGNGKYNPMREILDARRVLPGFLETLSRINSEGIGEGHGIWSKVLIGLEGEDWLFLSPAYQNALAQALAHTGYSIEEMLDGSNQDAAKALNRARVLAVEEAQKATYRDFNAAASMLNRIKRMETGKASDKALGILLEGILPFTKTPINILRRGVEYSPIGIASSIFEAAAKVKSGEFDMAEFIDHLSAGLTGSAVVVLGYLLSSLGYLRSKKDDKEEEFEKMQGYQDYSLQIGDVSATIDWAAPTALPLFTGAAIKDLMNGEDLEWKDAWDAMMMIAEPMMSLSMLDGLNNVLSSASYADDSQKLATVASSAFTSYLGQAFPTIAGQLARSIDGTRRATYVDKNSQVPSAIQRFVQSSVQSKTPGWEAQKIPYIDQWGREDTVNSKALGALENFLSPSYINLVHTTDVDETLRELYDATKDSDVLPARIQNRVVKVNGEDRYLTADQFVDISKYAGSTKYTMLTQLFSDPRYMRLSDEQKAKAVAKVYDYANTTGKYYIWNDYNLHGQGKWMEEMYDMPTDIQRFNRFWEYLESYLKLD